MKDLLHSIISALDCWDESTVGNNFSFHPQKKDLWLLTWTRCFTFIIEKWPNCQPKSYINIPIRAVMFCSFTNAQKIKQNETANKKTHCNDFTWCYWKWSKMEHSSYDLEMWLQTFSEVCALNQSKKYHQDRRTFLIL